MFSTIEIFGQVYGSYTLMAIAGALIMGVWACRTAAKRGYDDNDMIMLLLIAAIGVLLGGHLLYALLNMPLLLTVLGHLSPMDSVGQFFREWVPLLGGSVFYGGLLGGLAAGFVWMHHKKLDMAAYSDMLAPAIPLFHGFGRIGCFLGGCCYGVESHVGFIFNQSLVPEANGVRRFPVQLAEALGNLLLFLLLAALLHKGRGKGRLLAHYLLLYAILRFLLEFWRGDAVRGFIGVFSTSQFISLLLFAAAGLFLLVQRVRHTPPTC